MSVLCSCRPARVRGAATMMAPPRRKCLAGAKVTRPAKIFELETSWAKLYSSFPPMSQCNGGTGSTVEMGASLPGYCCYFSLFSLGPSR